MAASGWIGVDLDGTLAKYTSWDGGKIGEPIPAMADRVRQWIAEGRDVRIFTARVAFFSPAHSGPRWQEGADQCFAIRKWTLEHFGVELEVTATKDFAMIELWDDRAVSVEANTGRVLTEGR